MATKLSNSLADAKLAAVTTACNTGYLRIYDGTEPANANIALSGNTLLAELRFGSPSFGAAATSGSDRAITANAFTQDDAANATGTATFFRAFQSNGSTVVFQGTVGTSGQQLNLTSTSIVVDGPVQVTSMTYTQPTA
jgi:hypothetical protein